MITRSLLLIIARIASIILYAITVFAGFGGKFNPEYFTIPSILTLVFPYLVILTILTFVAWGVCRKWIMCALGIGVLVITWNSVKMAAPVGFSQNAPENSVTFKLITFNSLHFEDIRNPESTEQRAIHFLMDSGADIICLQELNTYFEDWEMKHDVNSSLLDSLRSVYPYWSRTDVFSDLKIFSKYPFSWDKKHSQASGFQPSYAAFRTEINGNPLTIVNVHLTSFNLTADEQNVVTNMNSVKNAKNSVDEFKQSIYSKMRSSFRRRSEVADDLIRTIEDIEGPVIICGDFNDVPASWAYRKFIDAGFRDAYTETSFGPKPTFNSHLFLFHLDQILYRGGLKALNTRRLNIDTSDHYPVEAEFAFDTKN